MSRRRSRRTARSIPLLTYVVKIWLPRTRRTCDGSAASTTSAHSTSCSPPRRPSASAATRRGSWSSAGPARPRPRRSRRWPARARTSSPPSTARPRCCPGPAKRDRSADATGGLLRKIGPHGLLVIKDFTSILSMNRDTRALVLAALREIYDGHWSRNVGTDGGQTLTWRGRVVVIGAVTTAWDSAYQVVSTMGDRFVLVRLSSGQHRRAAGKAGHGQRRPRDRDARRPRRARGQAAGRGEAGRGRRSRPGRPRRAARPGRPGDPGAHRGRTRLPGQPDVRARPGDADPVRQAARRRSSAAAWHSA